MKRILQHLVLGATVFITGTAMADVTFYENDNFSGRQFSIGQATPNFRDSGMNDRAQSAIIEGGNWEVCVDREYGGGCTVMAPGRYPSLAGWSRLISSARPTGASAGTVAGPVAQAPAPTYPATPTYQRSSERAGIVFYGQEYFGGRQLAADRSLPNLANAGFNDRAYSAIVEEGSWEISNALLVKETPLDVANFLEWRKREWWNLKAELAYHYNREWLSIEKLTKDVARYYGYNVQNFPRAKDDVLRFFAKADAEWCNLVQDIIIWQEYQSREVRRDWPAH